MSDAPLAGPPGFIPSSFLANEEKDILNTTKLQPNTALASAAEYTFRKQSGKWKRAFVEVWTDDQPVTLFVRDLSAQVATPNPDGSDWKIVPDGAGSVVGTALPAAQVNQLSVPLMGDDTRISVKAGATPPTNIRITVRLSPDQALNA